MDADLLTLLRSVDTPTVCNAIEAVQGRRGFDRFTRGTMQASDPVAVMVGYARTAEIAAARPPDEPSDAVRSRRMAYYRHMAEAPRPAIAVVGDRDFPNCTGAFWGEVNATVHRGFGLDGALTNGVMRDLGDLPSGFPIVAGSIGPSHAFVHVCAYGTRVCVLGLEIDEGELVHADRHGALVIPTDAVSGLADAIRRVQAVEATVLVPARKPGFDFEAFEVAWGKFERQRT